jgi:hypothetical protein
LEGRVDAPAGLSSDVRGEGALLVSGSRIVVPEPSRIIADA